MRKFNTSISGYNKDEVNAFVNQVVKEYESMLIKLKNRDEEIKKLASRLDHFEGMESALNKAMLVAEDSSNQIRKLAKDEANIIIENAKKNASRIVNDSLIKAERVDMEADQLKRRLKIYKARIKQVVEEQLEMVKDIDEIEY
jgi:cell division initiation protein